MIEKVCNNNLEEWANLCCELWGNHKKEAFLKDFYNGKYPYEFLYKLNGEYIGFMSLSKRNDYVEECETSPVAYLEGIYVKKEYRHEGIGKELIEFAKKWAKENDIKELASDCEIENCDSINFHKSVGFVESNRIVCFYIDLRN
jgi:aminoglycoside 6'-N-acetyltransferase I